MNDKTLIPLKQCLDINLEDRESVDITALHETGHLIVMYVLDMMDYFSYITADPCFRQNEVNRTIERVGGKNEITQQYRDKMSQHGTDVLNSMANLHSGLSIVNCLRESKVKSATLYLPEICRLFGGGAICRYYRLPNEDMCEKDYEDIDSKLKGLELPGTRDAMKKLVDKYLKSVFVSLDYLTKTIYANLKKYRTLNKDQVMQIIREWENYNIQ